MNIKYGLLVFLTAFFIGILNFVCPPVKSSSKVIISVTPHYNKLTTLNKEAIKPQPVAVVTIQSIPSNCTSGYFTGNYYEDYIISHESGGRSCATNYLGCFGLMQACPGLPLKQACGGDPVCQLNWFAEYKMPRYGSWYAVFCHEVSVGWW